MNFMRARRRVLDALINETYVCLIPKKMQNMIKDFRLITVVISLYKIIAKTLDEV